MSRPPASPLASTSTNAPRVLGVDVDEQTRCAHYHSATDIIAIKMACCKEYYACIECHAELSGHPATPWPVDKTRALAVLCGACRTELSIEAYLGCHHTCPVCGAAFNPGCSRHQHLYFGTSPA